MDEKTKQAPRAAGPYSLTVQCSGEVLYLAGQSSTDPTTGEPVQGSAQEQTRRTLQNVEALLESAGYTLEDLAQVTCFLTDIEDWSSMNEAYVDYFDGRSFPARAAVAVSALPFGLDVEMVCVAQRRAPAERNG